MNVKSKFAVGVLVLATVGGGGFLVARQITERAGEAEFQAQLRLARLESLPTTVAAFEATLPKVSPEDNAAPIYRKLARLDPAWRRAIDPDLSFVWVRNTKIEATVRSSVKKAKDALALIDAAAAKPKCRFELDWDTANPLFIPGVSSLKDAAKLLLVRGSLSSVAGEHASALADAKAILRIASHIDSPSGHFIFLVGEVIRHIGLQFIASLALRYPDQLAYRQVLKDVVANWEAPRLKQIFRGELVEIFKFIECAVAEKPGASAKESSIQLSFQAKANVVRAVRKRWAAFDAPEASRSDLTREAAKDLVKALEEVPWLAKLYDGAFGYGEFESVKNNACRRVAYQALLRALEQPTLPKTIKTDDLLSPFDKKPVTYKYEKGRILIEVSRSTTDWRPYRLEIGPPAKPGS
jgi:hypothetical protein